MKQPKKGPKKKKARGRVLTGATVPGVKTARGGRTAGGGGTVSGGRQFTPPGLKVTRGGHSSAAGPKVHKSKRPHQAHLKVPGLKVKRGASLATAPVAFCAAEALGTSLRLSGWPVSDEDVLALYWVTADDADSGASILDTLFAAADWGLAGVHPQSYGPVEFDDPAVVLLGVDLPGAHTVCVDRESGLWWSWGGLWDPGIFPAAVIEEAWAVTWPS